MSLFDIANSEVELEKLEAETLNPNFWSNQDNSKTVLEKIKRLKNKVQEFKKVKSKLDNLLEMIELIIIENDEALANEVISETGLLEKEVESLELKTYLSGKYDSNNAILTLHPGAGGTESQDWAEMLYRMYTRWAANNGFEVKEVDYLDGDEAGIKSVTFEVIGENAYGYLKGEMGVHRLVRISPFDSGGRRHTSFASLEVLPEITEDIILEINPDDLRVDTYRASGARTVSILTKQILQLE